MEFIKLNIISIVFVASFTAVASIPCNLSHSDNHICLHIYLERDFPLLHQMIINPLFIKEGREFDDACRYFNTYILLILLKEFIFVQPLDSNERLLRRIVK